MPRYVPGINFPILILLVAFFFIPGKDTLAQFIITGDFDARGEYLNLHRIIPDSMKNRSFNFLGSAEIDFAYRYKKLDAYLSLMAAYAAGSNLYSYTNTGSWSANAYETWLRYRFTNNFSIQAGRIEISYTDEQFFQARDWNKLVTSHNAIIAHWLPPDTAFMTDLGFAANKFSGSGTDFNTSPDINNYRYMGFLYFHKKFFDDRFLLTFSDILDASDNGVSKNLLYGRNTIGLSTWLAWPDWNLSLSGFYQAGHITDGRKLSAGYYSGYFSYKITDWLNLMVAGEHMSGDDFADSGEWKKVVHGFSILYGNSRKTMGLSGIFNTPFRGNVNPGLNNLYLKALFNITEDLCLETTYHWFSVPHAYLRTIDPVTLKPTLTKVTSSLMHEVDFLFTYTPVKSVEVNLNYGLIIPDRSITGFNGWDFGHNRLISCGYLEIEYTPVLLKPKVKKMKL